MERKGQAFLRRQRLSTARFKLCKKEWGVGSRINEVCDNLEFPVASSGASRSGRVNLLVRNKLGLSSAITPSGRSGRSGSIYRGAQVLTALRFIRSAIARILKTMLLGAESSSWAESGS